MAAAEVQAPFDPESSLWSDVKPVYQQESDTPLCPILYEPRYSKAMDLFRAFMQSPEFSARTLALTSHLIRLNPSNYTLWAYRARIILAKEASKSDAEAGADAADPFVRPLSRDLRQRLDDELDFMDVLAKANMKNYQVWQHRKVIVTALTASICSSVEERTIALSDAAADWQRVAARELAFVQDTLSKDSKNYHTWVYRQWVVCHLGGLPADAAGSADKALTRLRAEAGPGVWAGELAYVDELLEADLRNNSAWAHRFFVIFGSGRAAAAGTPSEAPAVSQEVDWTLAKLGIAPNNSSAWAYLRGILARLEQEAEARKSLRSKVDAYAQSLPSPAESGAEAKAGENASAPVVCPFALEWLYDSAVEAADTQRANTILDQLITADPMRTRYWEYLRSLL